MIQLFQLPTNQRLRPTSWCRRSSKAQVKPITSLHLRVPDGISTGEWVCLVKSVMIYGGEPLKWRVSPTTMGFPTRNWSFWGVKWGYHHLRKHPYLAKLYLVGGFSSPLWKIWAVVKLGSSSPRFGVNIENIRNTSFIFQQPIKRAKKKYHIILQSIHFVSANCGWSVSGWKLSTEIASFDSTQNMSHWMTPESGK